MNKEYEVIRKARVENARILGDYYRFINVHYEQYLVSSLYFSKPKVSSILINPTIETNFEEY
jgi:hypothetical protein